MPLLKSCTYTLFLLLALVSCRQNFKSEKEEAAYWNALVLDSAYRQLYKDSDTTAALQFFDAAVANAKYSSPFINAARYGILSSYYYFFTPDSETTARMVDSSLALLQDNYPHAKVGMLLFGGHLAYQLQQYNKANDYYFRAKKLGDTYLDHCEKKAFNYSIAMVLYRQQNYRQSMQYFKEAYALQNTCNPQTSAVILQQQEIQSNIGLCYVQLKNYDSAMVYFDKAWHIAQEYNDSLGPQVMDKIRGVLQGNRAQVFMAQNQLKKAEEHCLESIALNAKPGYEMKNAQQVQLQLAQVYDKQGNEKSMFQALQGLRSGLDTVPDPNVELGWRQLMSSFFENTGKAQLGLAMFKSYANLRDSLNGQQTLLSEADVNRQLEVKEREMQIAILKKDNHIALISLWVTIGAALLIMVIVVLIYQSYLRSKKSLAVSLALNKEIQRQKAAREAEAKQRHKQITEAVIRAQENERAIIGLELHDNINQVLTTVKLHNEMVLEGMGDSKEMLTRSTRYLQDCINEIRSLSKRLSAPSLGKISLEESVNDLLDSVNVTNKVKITRRITGMNNKMLRQDLHVGVYRIIQEQLNNVLKHAHATELLIELEKADQFIRLLISDNGKGFSTNSKYAGIGVVNMRTRAENMNGTFELQSKPGAGCQVEVVVPISE